LLVAHPAQTASGSVTSPTATRNSQLATDNLPLSTTIRRTTSVVRSPRVRVLEGTFDTPPATEITHEWHVEMDLPEQWAIGLIVGGSGTGKTTLATELFGDCLVGGRGEDGAERPMWTWPRDRSILDGFPKPLGCDEIFGLLSSVGFSSQRHWVKPFHVLSNGQQFRVNVARTLAEMTGRAAIDEFGSFVQQEVRQICAAAAAKAVRRRGQQLVAITCHADAIDWFDPDWVLEVLDGGVTRFTRAEEQANAQRLTEEGADAPRGAVQPARRGRPPIELEVVRTTPAAWERFSENHYLSADCHRGAKCFLGLVRGAPAAFTAVLPFPHAVRPGWREHRTVCLPDFQGVGIGNAMSEMVASLFAATGKPYFSATSHPAMIRHRMRSPLWRTTRKPSFTSRNGTTRTRAVGMAATTSSDRLTAGFEFVGPPRPDEARTLGVV
jgi:GNAT superfamily N-acetyltransferase